MSKPQLAGRLAQGFIHSKLTPLVLIAAIAMGAAAVVLLPREEEPQIIVPMIDVLVAMPGASAKEVESRVTRPMERLLWEIPGVEYVYSTSSPGASMAIVRFYVGEDEEKSIVRLNQKMLANFDLIPPGASQPLIKPRSIDDVPFLALTLWSSRMDGFEIRRVAAELRNDLQQIADISSTQIIGGQRRQLLVELDPARMAAFGVGASQVREILQSENREADAGTLGCRECCDCSTPEWLSALDGRRSLSCGRRPQWLPRLRPGYCPDYGWTGRTAGLCSFYSWAGSSLKGHPAGECGSRARRQV